MIELLVAMAVLVLLVVILGAVTEAASRSIRLSNRMVEEPGVIRLVVGFQLYPDNQPSTLQDGTSIANSVGQVVYSPPIRSVIPYGGGSSTSVVDISRISSLVVGLVVIDQTNLQQLTSTQIGLMETKFTVPANDTLPVASWGSTANSPGAFSPSIPLPARQSLRVYQCFFPISPFASHL